MDVNSITKTSTMSIAYPRRGLYFRGGRELPEAGVFRLKRARAISPPMSALFGPENDASCLDGLVSFIIPCISGGESIFAYDPNGDADA